MILHECDYRPLYVLFGSSLSAYSKRINFLPDAQFDYLPTRQDWLDFSRSFDIPLDRVRCKFCFIYDANDLPF